MHQLQTSDQIGSFLTLTYAEEHLPENGNLNKRDWQLFAKRLRQKCGKFSYIMCGEYGGQTDRCHLHAAVFGIDFIYPGDANRQIFKKNDQGHSLFTSPVLEKLWTKGTHLIGDVSFDSVSYVAGYITKKVNGKDAKEHYSRINIETGEVFDQTPEFGLMSRNPALGKRWIEANWREVYPRDEVLVNGVLAQPPLYYDRWMQENQPTIYEEVQKKRRTKGIEWENDNTPDRLAVKKKVFTARKAQYKRK